MKFRKSKIVILGLFHLKLCDVTWNHGGNLVVGEPDLKIAEGYFVEIYRVKSKVRSEQATYRKEGPENLKGGVDP